VTAGAGSDYVVVGREAEASQALSRLEAIWPNSQFVPYLAVQSAIYFRTVQEQIPILKKYQVHLEIGGTTKPDGTLMQRAVVTRDQALIRRSISNCFETYGQSGGEAWDDLCLFVMVQVGALDDAFRFAQIAYPDLRGLYPPMDDRWLTASPRTLGTTRLFAPRMAAFRNDPRFWQVALRTGLVNYWLTTQQWPDFCRGQLDACKARAAAAARGDTGIRPGG
jgi:hypothetical protein